MGNHCEAADFRPEEAWGSLPGRSAARIICLGLGNKTEVRVEIRARAFSLHSGNARLAHPWANQSCGIRLWRHFIKIQP
jgi:hypothetical protein